MNFKASKIATLLGTASLLALGSAITAQAQTDVSRSAAVAADADQAPETVLVTGSLIHGAVAVGVPVTNLSPRDFLQSSALTTADLFRNVPGANVLPGPVAVAPFSNIERGTRVNLRGLDKGAIHSLLMVDGVRFPPQGDGLCVLDPSIIPAIALDHVDVLVDGASATYGSDAMAGVINLVLKRKFDGAVSQFRYSGARGGKQKYQASQLWGRTWESGDITLSYEWADDSHTSGTAHSNFTVNFSPWGLDDRRPLASSVPGTISVGAPSTTLIGGVATLGTACSNCFAIPQGTGANWTGGSTGLGPTLPSSSASVLNWTTFNTASNSGTNGTRNVVDPYKLAWEDAQLQRNAATITFDQRLTKDISLFGDAFYSNRRAQFLNPGNASPASTEDLVIAVPTYNPYYPISAPTTLRVNYNINHEIPAITNAYEVAARYAIGLNIDLPGDWSGKVYYSESYDSNSFRVPFVNKNAVSAALGWTIASSAATGTSPGIATWTKPASVPYLNLFCDPTAFTCNAGATLNYITAGRSALERLVISEKGATFDGPLFRLPGGEVKMAVGGTYDSYHFFSQASDNANTSSLLQPLLTDARQRQVWAVFTQLNVPIIGEANALPGVRKLDVEGSWRHDQYSDVGGTSNPKVAFNWVLSDDVGFSIRGAWGTSFRAPSYGEISGVTSFSQQGFNLPANIFSNQTAVAINCSGGLPIPGTAGEALFNAGFACGATLGGISQGNGAEASAAIRTNGYNGGPTLKPEQATNWSIGFDLAPTAFLKGLDVRATWYKIKLTNVLNSFGNPNTSLFNAAPNRFTFIVPSDLGCPVAQNATPTLCAPFETMVSGLLNQTRAAVPLAAQPLIYWINDNGIFNKGYRNLEGIDWNWSYDWDMGDIGTFNIGQDGTYYLHDTTVAAPGIAPVDTYHSDLGAVGGIAQNGVESLPRMHYRARLGWSNDAWSVTAFMNYDSHYYHNQNAPPNVNFQCISSGSSTAGGTFPCLINGYSNIEPSFYTFDLSLGYDTGDGPSNEYLRHVGIQFGILNLMDKHPAFMYRTSTAAGSPSAYDTLKSNQGRTLTVSVTKTW